MAVFADETLHDFRLTARTIDLRNPWRDIEADLLSVIGLSAARKGEPDDFEIVGVVGDARFLILTQAAPPTVYLSLADFPTRSMNFELRTAVDAAAMKASIRDAMHRINPGLPVPNITTYSEIIERQIGDGRVMAWTLSRSRLFRLSSDSDNTSRAVDAAFESRLARVRAQTITPSKRRSSHKSWFSGPVVGISDP